MSINRWCQAAVMTCAASLGCSRPEIATAPGARPAAIAAKAQPIKRPDPQQFLAALERDFQRGGVTRADANRLRAGITMEKALTLLLPATGEAGELNTESFQGEDGGDYLLGFSEGPSPVLIYAEQQLPLPPLMQEKISVAAAADLRGTPLPATRRSKINEVFNGDLPPLRDSVTLDQIRALKPGMFLDECYAKLGSPRWKLINYRNAVLVTAGEGGAYVLLPDASGRLTYAWYYPPLEFNGQSRLGELRCLVVPYLRRWE